MLRIVLKLVTSAIVSRECNSMLSANSGGIFYVTVSVLVLDRMGKLSWSLLPSGMARGSSCFI